MKILLSYACDLEDIPATTSELLANLEENDLQHVTVELKNASLYSYDKNISEALQSIDKTRIKLAKIDQRLMDYSSILAGYARADADLKTGPSSTEPQENVEEENVNTEAEETND